MLFRFVLSLFLSGLRWHLPGLSELPLEQRLLLLLAGKSPLPFYSCCFRRRAFSHIFVFLRKTTSLFFLYVCYYAAVVVAHHQISTTLPYRKHSTTQHSAVNPHNKQQKQLLADQRATTQASRQDLARASSVVEHLYCIRLAVFSKRTEKPESARGLNKICNHCNHSQSSLAGFSWSDARRVSRYTVFLSVLSIPSMHAAPGLFSWTMELLAFASHELAPKTIDLSVRLIHSFYFVQFFLVSECSGRWKPPAERSTMYGLTLALRS